MFPSVYTIFSPLEYSYKLYSFLHTLEYLVEIVEYKKHPFFIGVQFHPELKSRPNRPAPVFVGLIKAAKEID